MAEPAQLTAEALLGYRFFPHPQSPTLGLLRLDTASDQHWLLVDRKTLTRLSEALAQEAEKLEAVQ